MMCFPTCAPSVVLMLILCSAASASIRLPNASGDVESDPRAFPVNQLPPLTYSSKHYTVYLEDSTFFAAWQNCIAKGKRLASVENYQDHKAFRKAIFPYANYLSAFWIAATNVGAKPNEYQKFYWITNDRPVGYLSGFENWIDAVAPNQANLCTAAYLGISAWISGTCDSLAYYVCEESQDV